jgi:hypothetical protein
MKPSLAIKPYTLMLAKMRVISVYSIIDNLPLISKVDAKAAKWIQAEVYFFNYLHNVKSGNL